jgi:asparagine synthase (glutamine-hydrolysing)
VCGIAGLISLDDSPLSESEIRSLRTLNEAMRHRGPDDEGLHITGSQTAAFAHRRLSIIDPTPEAHQPMIGAGGSVLVFNGEIYNFKELIAEYKLHVPPSDTAVLLALLESHGISILPKLRGFFSFAWWNEGKRELILVRDSIGKKPLYYGIFNKRFVFASETCALVASGLVPIELSPEGLANYFRFYCVPHPNSIFKGIQMLAPGSTLHLSQQGKPIVNEWYRLPKHHAVRMDYEEAKRETRRILERSVCDRLVSDVPIGAFLSGGLDSNAIVSLAMQKATTPIETFSIGFSSSSTTPDETSWARIGAQSYGTLHHEWKISDSEIADLLPEFFQAMDSPTGDGLNSFLVSKATRRASPNLKVVLSGVGGDEAFLGYHKYRWLARREFLFRSLWSLPDGFRTSVSESLLNARHTRFGSALRAVVMPENSRFLFSNKEIRHLTCSAVSDNHSDAVENDALLTLLRSDMEHYLPDMLLRDLDWVTMSQSLEARAPLLDRELLEFTWQLPLSIKTRGTTKQLLADSVSDILPKDILQKQKTGFELPMREWLLHGMLRPYLDGLTSGNLHIVKEGLMDNAAIMRVHSDFLRGNSHYLKPWSIIVLEHWYRSMKNISQTIYSEAHT